MSALLLALFCLLISAVSPGRAESTRPAGAKLTIYLKSEPEQSLRPLGALKQELARLMGSAGFEVEWRGPEDAHVETRDFLAMVELRGLCEAPMESSPIDTSLPRNADLASTYTSGGQILPFSWVNCHNVTNLLWDALSGQPGAIADYLYGRAVARLLAHEFYHILLQTSGHTKTGISKSNLGAGDLLSDRFEFDRATLLKLQVASIRRSPSAPGPDFGTPAEAAEAGSGRERQHL